MSQDSGYAWVVCAASFLAQVMIGGFLYTSGIFYIMFKNGIDASDSALSLITSLNIGLMMMVCPAVGLLSDRYGERCIAIIGAILSTIGLAASAFTTQVYQLYIFYGVLAGVGMGMTYNPFITILSKYFNKHYRMACACAMCGLGAGSFIIPPLLKALEEYYGWRGAILMLAGITSHNVILCCTFKPLKEWHGKKAGADSDVEIVEIGKKIPMNTTGFLTDVENKIGLVVLNGINKSLSNTNNINNSSISIDKNCSDMKATFTNHTDMGAFCRSASDLSHPHKTSTDMNIPNKRSCNISRHYRSLSDIKVLSRSSHDLVIYTGDAKASDSIAKRLLALFRITPFLCLILFFLTVQFPVAIVYTHFGNYVLTLGYSSSDVVGLYMAIGITCTLSRPLIGSLAQAINANIAAIILVTNVANGVLTAALPLTTNLVLMYIYAVVFSALLSSSNVLAPPFVMESVPAPQVSTGFGLVCCFCAPGNVLGAPLAAWLYAFTNIYYYSFNMAGGLMVIAGLIMSHPADIVFRDRRAQAARTTL